MDELIKIVITGPESTGKSWLAENLAKHFGAIYVPEYARLFLEKHGPSYDFELLEQMARQHLHHQKSYLKRAGKIVFLDTDLINYLVWEKLVFEKTHRFIENASAKEADHKYLITYPDIPWEADPLRENPDDRMQIFDHQLRAIANQKRAYRIIKGTGAQRLTNSITATKELLR